MKNVIRIVILVLCVGVPRFTSYSQNRTGTLFDAVRNYSIQNPKKGCLSMQLLKSASDITYGFNNGSVDPDFQYSGTIQVTPADVTLTIRNGSGVCYTETSALTAQQYSGFLTRLYSLGLKKNQEEYIPQCGGGVYSKKIKNGSRTLFQGNEHEDVVVTARGKMLSSAFVPLLSPDMKEVYDDPLSTFEIRIDDDYTIF